MMDTGFLYLGKISRTSEEYEVLRDFTASNHLDHCSLTIARFMTRDDKCFYAIGKATRISDTDELVDIRVIIKIDTKKLMDIRSPVVESTELETEQDLVDICATNKYIIACSNSEVFKI